MRRIAQIALFLLLIGSPVRAEPPKVYTLSLPAEAVDVIGKALGDRPYREVAPVVNMLQQQIDAQNRSAMAPASPPTPAEPEPPKRNRRHRVGH